MARIPRLSAGQVVAYYRKHDDFRYLISDKARVRDLRRVCASTRQYCGKSVLDIARGGGVI